MKASIILSVLLGFLVFSCTNDEPNPANVTVNLQFNHLVDNAPVLLDQIIYKNALDQEFSIKTVKYFISGFKIHNTDGTTISFDDIHYVDIRDSETLTYSFENKITPGEYAGISFIHGLAKEDNVTGSLGLELDKLMEWPIMMGGGYHYMKLEGEYIAGTTESFFNFHSGGLNGGEYEVNVDLSNQSFKAKDELNIALQMEIQHWFTNPVDWDFTYFGSGIMGNQEAQETVQKNGRDVYSFAINEKTVCSNSSL